MAKTKTNPAFTPSKPSYTTAEAAVYLSVSAQTIRSLIYRGLLRKSHALSKTIIPGEDVEQFFAKTC